MKLINTDLLSEITAQAKSNPRKRMNYNFHESGDEILQRMLNALEPGTYLPPHRHTEQIEVFLLLTGKLSVLFFDDNGNITQHQSLDPKTGNYGLEVPIGVWHTMIIEESGSVIYEIKQGPYIPNTGIEFAPWAPEAADTSSCQQYLKELASIIE